MSPEELCTNCASLVNSIFSEQLPVGQQCSHYTTFAELDDSAISCCLCALFRRNVMLRIYFENSVWPDGEETLKLIRTDIGRRQLLPSLAQAQGSTIEIQCGKRKLVTCDYALDIDGFYSPNHRVTAYSADEEHIWPPQSLYELAREWIETCTSTHDCSDRRPRQCDSPAEVFKALELYSNAPMSLLPTRVIDVGETGSNVKIVVSSAQTRGHYLALSYCWGQGPHDYVTTKMNLSKRTDSLSIDSLPRTIRDAIEITRTLHVRYLWVDACCILQPTAEEPDLSDWQCEAPKMVDVYGGALCTIAAADAKGCNEGCFTGRRALSIPAGEVVVSGSPSKSQLIFTKGFLPWVCASSGPLDHRAWVLQESFISPRTLYWTNYGLFWGCKEFHLSESQPTEDAEGFEDVRPPLNQEKILSKSGAYAWERIHTGWLDIVMRYSPLGLSVQTDKLIAVTGMAKLVQRRIPKDHYVAGLWAGNLIPGLSWTVSGQGHSRLRQYVAPSWSWASLHGKVWWHFLDAPETMVDYSWNAEVREIKIMADDNDPFGVLERGTSISVEGYVGEVAVGPRDAARANIFSPMARCDTITFRSDVSSKTSGHRSSSHSVWRHRGEMIFDEAPEGQDDIPGTVHCLQLCTKRIGSNSLETRFVEEGLILRRSHGVRTFERLGYFRFQLDDQMLLDRRVITIL